MKPPVAVLLVPVIACLLAVLTLAAVAELLLAEHTMVAQALGGAAARGLDNDEDVEAGEIVDRLAQLLDVVGPTSHAEDGPGRSASAIRPWPRPAIAALVPAVQAPPPR
jgi:hypothetical protein